MTFEQILYSFIEFRLYERILGMLIGAFVIYLGYSLFKSGIETPQSGDVKIGSFEFRLLKVAPGTFFSLFGVLLVGFVTYNHPTLEQIKTYIDQNNTNAASTQTKINAGFSRTEYDELLSLAKPINTAKQALSNLPKELSGVEIDDIKSYGQLILAVNELHKIIHNKIFYKLPPEVVSACQGKGTLPKEFTSDICTKRKEQKNETMK